MVQSRVGLVRCEENFFAWNIGRDCVHAIT